MSGPCANTIVTCTLITPSGQRFVGTNYCLNPQAVCPRCPGEDYTKCKTICNQQGHAEENALKLAGSAAKGAHAYIEGNTYACRNCQELLVKAGVAAFTIGPPPKWSKTFWDNLRYHWSKL